MIKQLARLATLAALVAACTDAVTDPGPGPFAGQPAVPAPTSSPITMMPALAVAGAQVTFTNAGLFDNDAYARNWEFGDGTSAEGASVTHVFQNSGQYDVIVVGSDGITTRTATMTVSVAAADPGILPPPQEIRQP